MRNSPEISLNRFSLALGKDILLFSWLCLLTKSGEVPCDFLSVIGGYKILFCSFLFSYNIYQSKNKIFTSTKYKTTRETKQFS